MSEEFAEPAFAACDATVKNGFDETVRCGLPAGHALNRGSDTPGVGGHYDHTGQTAAGTLLWWKDTAADAVPSTFPADNPAGDELPKREPGAALDGTTDADASRWMDAFFDGVPRTINDQRRRAGLPTLRVPTLRVTALNPQPVRVRFVDLPHRHGEREVDGIPVGIIEPGGFALVVDRFKHLAHLEAERDMWTAWADLIGARTVLCYPGELDIVDYLSE